MSHGKDPSQARMEASLQTAVPTDVEPTDRSLLRRLRAGSEDAATQLYERYAQRLKALAKARSSTDLTQREAPEDIVQSAFGSFFRGAKGGQYDVPAGQDLWNLLLVIALNKIRAKGAYHTAAKRDVRQTLGSNALKFSEPALPADTGWGSLNDTVGGILDRLPPAQQQIVMLRIQGHDIREISELTARSYRTIERVLKSFRETLAAVLAEEGRKC